MTPLEDVMIDVFWFLRFLFVSRSRVVSTTLLGRTTASGVIVGAGGGGGGGGTGGIFGFKKPILHNHP
tara:strand:- start:1 stop:204 length:204 start_codon:yes stop_codon:yes gene_type:complete